MWLWIILLAILILHPVICISLTLQKCPAKNFATNADMKQAVTSWLSHFTLISSTPQHKPLSHGGTNA
jgi:hypothetical protein